MPKRPGYENAYRYGFGLGTRGKRGGEIKDDGSLKQSGYENAYRYGFGLGKRGGEVLDQDSSSEENSDEVQPSPSEDRLAADDVSDRVDLLKRSQPPDYYTVYIPSNYMKHLTRIEPAFGIDNLMRLPVSLVDSLRYRKRDKLQESIGQLIDQKTNQKSAGTRFPLYGFGLGK